MHDLHQIAANLVSQMGYAGVFIWMTVSAFIPIPSEAVLPLAGVLIVTKHQFNFWALILIGSLGNLVGSVIAYGLGAIKGREFFEKNGKYFLIRKKDIADADKLFEKHGDAAVFWSRMVPVIRAFISYPAGIAKMPFGKFCFYTFLGGIPWCAGLTYIGIKFGTQWETIGAIIHKIGIGVVVLLVIGIAVWLKHHTTEHDEQVTIDEAANTPVASK